MTLESLETLISSPYFLAAILACGAWLLMLVAREFALWFLNIATIEKKMMKSQESLMRIENQVNSVLERLHSMDKFNSSEPVAKPQNETAKSSFPLSH